LAFPLPSTLISSQGCASDLTTELTKNLTSDLPEVSDAHAQAK